MYVRVCMYRLTCRVVLALYAHVDTCCSHCPKCQGRVCRNLCSGRRRVESDIIISVRIFFLFLSLFFSPCLSGVLPRVIVFSLSHPLLLTLPHPSPLDHHRFSQLHCVGDDRSRLLYFEWLVLP